MCRGQVVSVLAFNSDYSCLIPTEVYNFIVYKLLEKNQSIQKEAVNGPIKKLRENMTVTVDSTKSYIKQSTLINYRI